MGLTVSIHQRWSLKRSLADEDILLLFPVFGYMGTFFHYRLGVSEVDMKPLYIPPCDLLLMCFFQQTGVPLNVSIRLQLNLYMKKVAGIT